MRQFAEGSAGILAVDGKTLRRSYDHAEQRSLLHLVSAWAEEQRLVLGQLAVDDKSNEITALLRLLEMLTLRGKVVTADAMHCQRQVAQQVIEQGGDYALALKAIKAVCGMIRSCFWKTRPRRWPRMSKSARDTGVLKPALPASFRCGLVAGSASLAGPVIGQRSCRGQSDRHPAAGRGQK